MQNTEELITRTYFESLGFCTRFVPLESQERSKECRFLEIAKIEKTVNSARSSSGFQLFSSDFQNVIRATLVLHSWPTLFWEQSLLKSSKRLTAQIKKSLKSMSSEIVTGRLDSPALMPVPAWPTAEADRKQASDLIKGLGIQGIVTYRTMLGKLSDSPELPNSDHNPIPGTLRMLKAFQLLSNPQRDLFS